MATGWPMKTTYANGDVYSASDVNDITGTINLLGSSVAYTAGKNKIINGDFYVNQRNFSSTTTTGTYGFDRWLIDYSSGTLTYSTQNFTPGTAPVSGYEGKSFARLVTASQTGTSAYAALKQRIEDVRTFAGQTVTFSFWAKASTGTPNIGVTLAQGSGSGGSGGAITSAAVKSITSSWARYSFTINVPSISGMTIGTSSFLEAWIFTSAGTSISALGYPAVGVQNVTIDIWGVQVEQGSTATAFQTATGTIQGELAACQRYYYRFGGSNAYQYFAFGTGQNSTTAPFIVYNPVTMRANPTSVDYSTLGLSDSVNALLTVNSLSIDIATPNAVNVAAVVSSGITTYRPYRLLANASTNAYIGFSAEL